MKKLKVVHFHNGAGGGVLSVIRNLLLYNTNDGIENHVIYTIEENKQRDFILPNLDGATTEKIFYYSSKNNFYYTCKQLARLLPSNDCLIVAHDWLELGMVSNLGLSNPVVHIVHGDYDYYYDLSVKHCNQVDAFIAVSSSIASILTTIIPNGNIHYIRFPVPENEWQKTIPPQANENNPLSIVFIGRFNEDKGFHLLPEIKDALLEIGIKTQWHLFGDSCSTISWKNQSDVFCYGVIKNELLRKTIAPFDILVLPSKAEGMPVSVIEGMKAGLVPIVNNIAGGIRELIDHEKNGFLTSNTSKDYIEIIKKLYNNRIYLSSLKDEAITKANHLFDPKKNTENYNQLFLSIANKVYHKKPTKIYGSRLDHPLIPNFIVKMFR